MIYWAQNTHLCLLAWTVIPIAPTTSRSKITATHAAAKVFVTSGDSSLKTPRRNQAERAMAITACPHLGPSYKYSSITHASPGKATAPRKKAAFGESDLFPVSSEFISDFSAPYAGAITGPEVFISSTSADFIDRFLVIIWAIFSPKNCNMSASCSLKSSI